MFGIAECTRRCVLRLGASFLLNSAATRLSASGRLSAFKQAGDAVATDATTWHYREYAVHATVMLRSLPLCLKRGVGGAAIAFEQARQNRSVVTGLQLIAGTWPDRLRGFNRFGATQEIVTEKSEAVTQSGYAGLMSASREKGLSDARSAYAAAAAARTQMFNIAFGRATAAGCAFLTQERILDAKVRWTDCAVLLDGVEAGSTLPREEQPANYGPGCLPTFLFVVQRAIMRSTDRRSNYIHNGKVCHLRTQSKEDPASGHHVISVWTSADGERGETEFKVWIAPDDPATLPVKIEFRARSFLKLTLEAQPSVRERALQPLLKHHERVRT